MLLALKLEYRSLPCAIKLSNFSLLDALVGANTVYLLLRVLRTNDTIIVYTGTAKGSVILVLKRSFEFHGGV